MLLLLTLGGMIFAAAGHQGPPDSEPGLAAVKDVFKPILGSEHVLLEGGFLGARIDANAKNRMLKVDEDDLLDAFERREVKHQDWQGEHVGKYLHAAMLTWSYTHDPILSAKVDRVVTRLLKTQEADGYLGTYLPAQRWTSWDVWVHKYDLIGLLAYYQFTKIENGDRPTSLGNKALAACRRVGDLLTATFGMGKRDINRAGEHVGMAATSVLEPMVLLYRATNDKRYLHFAHYIVANYDAPGGPGILTSLESKKSVRAVANAKAYEMTSNFNGLLELYRVTGEKRLLDLMKIAWEDIVKNRLYITGSASSGERFQDDFHLPNQASICETCVTVTWEQMNLELLRLTGDHRYADELEKSIYNHLLAAQKPSGDDWVYYTPLEGHKQFDSFTTCCHSSGPRGIALIPEIAYMESSDGGLVVNFYNSGRAQTKVKGGWPVELTQTTSYPWHGDIILKVEPGRSSERFPLRLRIPPSALGYKVTLNGRPVPKSEIHRVEHGYLVLDRMWKFGDLVELKLDLADRVVLGDHENAGKAAIMHGPLVLALDTAANDRTNALRSYGLGLRHAEHPDLKLDRSSPVKFRIQGEVAGKGRVPIDLVPYAEAGADGKSKFVVWIPLTAPQSVSGSLLTGFSWSASRQGNVAGDLTDDDPTTFAVTYDGHKRAEDWFAVETGRPILVNRIVFTHGATFHDGGWFDTEGGKEKVRVQAQTEAGGDWKTIATLDSYPNTTASDPASLKNGQRFEARFPSLKIVAIRVIGRPACGDAPNQSFTSCAEIQAFHN